MSAEQAQNLRGVQNDAALARALVARDPGAPRQAWQRFRPLVFSILRRALGPDDELDDVAQDVFMRIFSGIHRLREPEALRAFVITVTKRAVGHEARRRRARVPLHTEQEAQILMAVGVTADAAAHLAFNHLQRLLSRMNERERRAFVLRFVDRMEAKELADTLGVSEPTARRAYARAWKRVLTWADRHPFLHDYVESWSADMKPPIARRSDTRRPPSQPPRAIYSSAPA